MAKKVTKETLDTAYQLYLNWDDYKTISKKLNISLSTIKEKLKTNYGVIPMKKLPVLDWRLFIPLWEKDLSDSEIADKLGISTEVAIRFRKLYTSYNAINNAQSIDGYLEQFLLGSLLGDSYICKPSKFGDSRLSIVHTKEQEKLFMAKTDLLGDLMGSYRLVSYWDKRTNREYFTYRGESKYNILFKNIWDITYSNNGKKLVTRYWLDLINSPLALAYWFMDDGTFRGTIATNGFSEAEVDLLISWMKEKWGIVCSKQQNVQSTVQYVIHISSHSRYKFEELIFPYVIPTMYYKLKYATILLEK